jgi:hypothetical protein
VKIIVPRMDDVNCACATCLLLLYLPLWVDWQGRGRVAIHIRDG